MVTAARAIRSFDLCCVNRRYEPASAAEGPGAVRADEVEARGEPGGFGLLDAELVLHVDDFERVLPGPASLVDDRGLGLLHEQLGGGVQSVQELLLRDRPLEQRVALRLVGRGVDCRALELARRGRPGRLGPRLSLLLEVGVVVRGHLLDVFRVLQQLLLLARQDLLAAGGLLAGHPHLLVVLRILLPAHFLLQVAVAALHQPFLQLEVVLEDFLSDAHLELGELQVPCR